jgi:hypothetical protein
MTKRIGDSTVRMLAYNGSIPGPTLRVREDSGLVVNVAVYRTKDLETAGQSRDLQISNSTASRPSISDDGQARALSSMRVFAGS